MRQLNAEMGKLRLLVWVGIYWLSRVGLLLPRRLISTEAGYAVATRVADLCYYGFGSARRNLLANLAPVLGDPEQVRLAAREAFRNYARYVIDLFQLPVLGSDAIRERVDFDDWRSLRAAADDARGTVFVTLHLGQWEMGAAALVAYGYPVSVIAQTLEYKPMNELVQGFRRQLGMRIIPGDKPGPEMFRCLARNEMLGMLIDGVKTGEGVEVDFFGGRAEMSDAPARIALRTGARVISAVLARDPQKPTRLRPVIDAELCFERTGNEEDDVAALTQALASSFEALVRRFPDQWFAFGPVWQTCLPPGKSVPGRQNGRPVHSGRAETDERARRNLVALRIANGVFGRLPKRLNYQVARLTGDLVCRFRPDILNDVEDNIRHVLGPDAAAVDVRAAAREAVRNVCRYYADLIRLPRTSGGQLLAQEITIHGIESLRLALAGGRGAVVATAHFGNPEIAVQVAKEVGVDLLVLSERLDPPALSYLVHKLRRANGAEYVEVGFRNMSRALEHLRKGGCLAITCDRDIQRSGVPLPFFGVETAMPLGAVDLAARTRAALVPAYCRRTGDSFEVIFEQPLEMVRTGSARQDAIVNACRLLGRIEEWIRSDPGQWMVLERIWKPQLERPVKGKRGMADTAQTAARL